MGNTGITCFGDNAMTTATSRLTSKYQATIPADIRKHLELQTGDTVAFEIREDGVFISKAQPLDID